MLTEDNKIEPIKQKLDEKIKLLNSSRVIKKVTPKGDLSWYIKWISSFIILAGMVLTASGGVEPYNLFFHFIGVSGWLVVGYLWHDRALIVLNSISLAIYTLGIINYYYG